MSVWIEWEVPLPEEKRQAINLLLEQAMEAALREEQIDTAVEISLSVVSEETIQQVNCEFRQMDRVTDVLSFPMIEYEGKAPADGVRHGEVNPDTGEVCLGDIMICYARAVQQAEEYGHSQERELAFLTVHSMLHLFGYDHMEPAEEVQMLEKQKKILEGIGITR